MCITNSSVLFGMIGSRKECVSHCLYLSVCLCDCCCKCVYACFACVCAFIHTILTVDDAWIGIIGHNMAKQDVRYYRIL